MVMSTPTDKKIRSGKHKKADKLTLNDKRVLKRARILPHGKMPIPKKAAEHESDATTRKQ